MAAMAVLISSKVWLLFIAFAVMLVVGSPTMDNFVGICGLSLEKTVNITFQMLTEKWQKT